MATSQRTNSTPRAPAPRPFETVIPVERHSRTPPPPQPKRSWLQALNPFSAGPPPQSSNLPKPSSTHANSAAHARNTTARPGPQRDLARGMEAARRVVTEGKLDARYRSHSRRILSVIVALPIAIVGGWELYQRLALGKVPRQIPGIGPAVGEGYK